MALCIGIFGQSFATGLATAAAVDVMKRELALSGYAGVTTMTYTAGNTRVAEWWDGVNGKLGVHGQAAIDLIRAATVKPTHILWLQGEADAYSPNEAQFRADTGNILYRLRNVSKSTDPASVPVVSHVVGRFVPTAQPGNQVIRSAQHKMARDNTGVRAINRLIDCFDLDILHDDPINRKPNDRHLTPLGYAALGYRAAHGILAASAKPSALPNIAASAAKSGTHDVTISVVGSFAAPLSPELFGLSQGGVVSAPVSITAATNSLTATFAYPVNAGDTLIYPYGQMLNLNRAAIVRDQRGRSLPSFTLPVGAP